MKKIKFLFTISLVAALLFSCASTDPDEPVISSIAADHITVDVTKSNVKITLTKAEGEDISEIDLIETPNGSLTTVQMSEPTISFVWPFAEPNKEYTLCAKIIGVKNSSEEYVTFKTGDEIASKVSYSEKFENTDLSLVAKGNQRFVQINANLDTLTSILSKAKADNVYFAMDIFSGKHYKAKDTDSELVGTFASPVTSKVLYERFIKGYDIIEHSVELNLTASDLNKKLASRDTYYAVASVTFKLPDYPAGVSFKSRGIYSNDTIYTPIAEADLPVTNGIDAK
ncbi:MAG: hypothetical protein MJ160_03030 [Treponema sp.]|nr:hypothetical protein [Treponema sp.]